MRSKYSIVFLVLFSFIFSACQAAPTEASLPTNEPTKIPPSSTPLPSDTPIPSETPLPTETPIPTNTPLPAGVLFRDDFEGVFQPGWEWENEKPDHWKFSGDGWLQIDGERNSLLTDQVQNNLLWYPLPAGDFAIVAHIKASPTMDFQQVTLYLYEDPSNYVAVNRGFCSFCVAGGGAFFMEYKTSGNVGAYNFVTDADDFYLKITSVGNNISGYFALALDEWVRIGQFGNYFEFMKVGIGVSSVGAADELVGLIDFFEISLP